MGYSKKLMRTLKDNGIDIGDIVEIEDSKTKIKGMILPKPEIGDPNVLLIKLDSGYNIGIRINEKTKIKKIQKNIKNFKYSDNNKLTRFFFDSNLPWISFLGTGGTIASRIDYKSGGVHASFTAEDIVKAVPELQNIANIRAERIMNIMSENMRVKHWKKIGKYIKREIQSGVDGIIITHGTDTLHYTSAALSFMLRNLPIPVVLVGSQRSSDRPSSDMYLNVLCAARLVVNTDIAEVSIVMHGTSSDDYCLAHRGTKVRKMHTSARWAFKSINDIPLAKIFRDGTIRILNHSYRKKNKDNTLFLDDKFERKVALIKFYPGLDPDIFEFYTNKGYRGFVIEATGLGHVATRGNYSLIPPIRRLTKDGIPVVITSQCIYGRVNPYVYRNLRILHKAGAIFGEDMLSEVAYVKLMWVLGHTTDLEEVKKMMLTNYAGEITPYSKYIF